MLSITTGQERHILNLIREKGLTRDEITTLVNGGFLSTLLESARQNMLPDISAFRRAVALQFEVRVYAELLGEVVQKQALDFPHVPAEPYTASVELLFPRREVSTDGMKKLFAKRFRSATFLELVALGAQYPNIHAQGPIVALVENPTYDHDFGMGYPFLDNVKSDGPAKVNVVHGVMCWDATCRFAVVRL